MNQKHNSSGTHLSQEPSGIRQQACAFSEMTADVIYAAVRRTMKDIDAEIASGRGKYLRNGGELSRLGVYRRAGTSQVTLANVHLYERLREEVDVWLKERARKVAA